MVSERVSYVGLQALRTIYADRLCDSEGHGRVSAVDRASDHRARDSAQTKPYRYH